MPAREKDHEQDHPSKQHDAWRLALLQQSPIAWRQPSHGARGQSHAWCCIFHFPVVVLHLPFSCCLLLSRCVLGPVISMYLSNVFLSLNASSKHSNAVYHPRKSAIHEFQTFDFLCVCNDLCFTSTNLKRHLIVFQVKSIIFLSLLLC